FHLFVFCLGDCGFPERISNAEPKQGALDQTTFPPNATVSYDCRPGYTRVPGRKNSITCLENGSWSTPEAFCQHAFYICPPLSRFKFIRLSRKVAFVSAYRTAGFVYRTNEMSENA
ncbi:hypothetical protein AB205_0133830, partial [Aquarana catesbeiana]